jgi:uncharacterized protein
MSRDCTGCGATARQAATFCRQCGARMPDVALETSPPTTVLPASATARPAGEALALARPVGALMGCLLLAQAVSMIAVKVRPATGPPVEVVDTAAQAVIVIAFAAKEGLAIRQLLGWRIELRGLWRAAPVVVIGCIAVVAYFKLLFGPLALEELKTIVYWTRYGWPSWGAFVLSCAAAPVIEEVAFRGFVQTRLARVMPTRDAVLVQAALFSVLHLLPLSFPSHFVLGVVFGQLRQSTRSLYPGLVAHAAWNAVWIASEFG